MSHPSTHQCTFLSDEAQSDQVLWLQFCLGSMIERWRPRLVVSMIFVAAVVGSVFAWIHQQSLYNEYHSSLEAYNNSGCKDLTDDKATWGMDSCSTETIHYTNQHNKDYDDEDALWSCYIYKGLEGSESEDCLELCLAVCDEKSAMYGNAIIATTLGIAGVFSAMSCLLLIQKDCDYASARITNRRYDNYPILGGYSDSDSDDESNAQDNEWSFWDFFPCKKGKEKTANLEEEYGTFYDDQVNGLQMQPMQMGSSV
ncbi:MAG: hypothetical protein ACE365_05165 [Gammaproteobacteria bacterium]